MVKGEVAHLKKLNFQFMVSLSLAPFSRPPSLNCSCKLKILSLDKNINFPLTPPLRFFLTHKGRKACAEFYGSDEVSRGAVLLHIQVPKG